MMVKNKKKIAKHVLLAASCIAVLAIPAMAQISLDPVDITYTPPTPTVNAQFTSPADGSTITSDVFPVNQTICGSVTANGGGSENLSIMLVLDVSGSMATGLSGGASRLDQLKQSVKKMLGDLDASKTQVGIVQFGHDVSGNLNGVGLVSEMTSDFTSLESAIDGLYPAGLTPTGDGMQLAMTELEKYSPAGAAKYQVVASDGYWNTGVDPETVASLANNTFGQTVHTVGISSDHNAAKMQAIAAAGGGNYYDATDLSNLDSIFTTGGSFVGIDSAFLNGANITSELNAFGQFCLDHPINEGNNDFLLEGYAGDGYGSDELSLIGVRRGDQPPIPEPTTALLLGLGIAGVAFGARRKK